MIISLPLVNSQVTDSEDTNINLHFDSPIGKFDNNTIQNLGNLTSVASCFKSEIAKFENNTVRNFTDQNFSAVLSFSSCLFKPISGFYEDNHIGYRIDLPQGWNGFELVFFRWLLLSRKCHPLIQF